MEPSVMWKDVETFSGEGVQHPNQNSVNFITGDNLGLLVDFRSMKLTFPLTTMKST